MAAKAIQMEQVKQILQLKRDGHFVEERRLHISLKSVIR